MFIPLIHKIDELSEAKGGECFLLLMFFNGRFRILTYMGYYLFFIDSALFHKEFGVASEDSDTIGVIDQ